MKRINYFAFLIMTLSTSCTSHNSVDISGTWINSNLDYITFTSDQIMLGYGFALPSERFSYTLINDTIVLKANSGYGDPNDGYKCRFTFDLIDSVTIVVSSNQIGGFFGRSGHHLNRFIKSSNVFKVHDWDSLIQRKYIQLVFGATETVMEEIRVTSDGKVYIETKLIDTLRNGRYGSLDNIPKWATIQKQISYIDTSYFHLLQSEVSDGYLMEILLYREKGAVRLVGYDFPLLFPELHDFLCCDYKQLNYSPLIK